VIYTSGSYLTNLNNPWQKFSDWTRVDIGARYVTAFNGQPVTIRANIENLFDNNYCHNRHVRNGRLAANLHRVGCIRFLIECSRRGRGGYPEKWIALPSLERYLREIAGTWVHDLCRIRTDARAHQDFEVPK
jgi:hypothetical protein